MPMTAVALKLDECLRRWNAAKAEQVERLVGDTSARRVLDLDVPTITLPVMPGRNLAVLTEAAARTHILRSKGVDPAAAFMARHSHFLERGTP